MEITNKAQQFADYFCERLLSIKGRTKACIWMFPYKELNHLIASVYQKSINDNLTIMEKTYKRVPFDIELAKKIQSGEVEGRIVADDGLQVSIVYWDRQNHYYPIVGLYLNLTAYYFNKDGVSDPKDGEEFRLYLELPEEAPKHEFKIGDRVKVIDIPFVNKYDGQYLGKEFIIKSINTYMCTAIIEKEGWKDNEFPFDCLALVNEKKHKFNPFDKVLVRNPVSVNPLDIFDRNEWVPAIFQYKTDDNIFIAEHSRWKQCIPYEGNEHLIGTTDNPKEE